MEQGQLQRTDCGALGQHYQVTDGDLAGPNHSNWRSAGSSSSQESRNRW